MQDIQQMILSFKSIGLNANEFSLTSTIYSYRTYMTETLINFLVMTVP